MSALEKIAEALDALGLERDAEAVKVAAAPPPETKVASSAEAFNALLRDRFGTELPEELRAKLATTDDGKLLEALDTFVKQAAAPAPSFGDAVESRDLSNITPRTRAEAIKLADEQFAAAVFDATEGYYEG